MPLGYGLGNMQETPSSKCGKSVLEKHLSSLSKVESRAPIISVLVIVTREFKDNTLLTHTSSRILSFGVHYW